MSAETLIVREQGDYVLFLSPLLHSPDTMLMSLPAAGKQALIANMALRGIQGPAVGTDYRNVPVYATIRRVSGLPWYLIAKIDREEVAREAGSVSRVVLVGMLVFALLLSAWVIMRWTQQAAGLRRNRRACARGWTRRRSWNQSRCSRPCRA